MSKLCTKCKIVKPLDSFGAAKKHGDGLKYHCKDCLSKFERDHREMKSYVLPGSCIPDLLRVLKTTKNV
jgi:hypothetical protein